MELKPLRPQNPVHTFVHTKRHIHEQAPTSAEAVPVLRTFPLEPLAGVRTFEGNFKIRKVEMSVVLSISAPFSVAPEKCREGSDQMGTPGWWPPGD